MNYPVTFPYPYLQGIDAEESNVFKCLINPRDTIKNYILTILDSSDDIVACVRGYLKEDNNGNIEQKKCCKIGEKKEVELSITPNDSKLPLRGVFDDETWLCVEIPSRVEILGMETPKNILSNGNNYKWKLEVFDAMYDIVPKVYGTNHAGSDDYASSVTFDKINGLSSNDTSDLWFRYGDEYYDVHHIADSQVFLWERLPSDPTDSSKAETPIYIGIRRYEYPSEYYFQARKNPNIDFDIPDIINSSTLDVNFTYTQEQSVPVSYYIFNLYLGSKLINTTGEIYSSDIRYKYFGLLNDSTYTLELILEDNVKRQFVYSKDFNVSYEIFNTLAAPLLEVNNQKCCINIDISSNAVISGVLEGQQDINLFKYKLTDGSSEVETNAMRLNDQSIYWNKTNNLDLNIPYESSVILHWHGDTGFNGIIFEKIDESNWMTNVSVGFNGKSFYYKIGTNAVVEYNIYEQEQSAIFHSEDEIPNIEGNTTLYILNEEDEILGTDILYSNDLTYKYWWHIIVLPDEVKFIRGQKYSEERVVIG